jgi:hypothetical protein
MHHFSDPPLCAAILIALLSFAPTASAADTVPEDAKPILAATKVLDIENHLHQDISLLDEMNADIGSDFHVSRSTPTDCFFKLTRRGHLIETLDFSKLTGEYSLTQDGRYIRVVFTGIEGSRADCDLQTRRCTDGLELELNGDEVRDIMRDMRFIFTHACKPAEPPL